jgi:hypothetical protein
MPFSKPPLDPFGLWKQIRTNTELEVKAMVEWEGRDPRLIRLFDLADDDRIQISCPKCSSIKDYGSEYFQRRMRFPSDMLVYDLQFRIGACSQCNRAYGFGIQITKLGHHPEQPPIVVVERDRV